MPEISRLFGIIVRMFAEPAVPHHRSHFHAYYQNHAAVFAIDTLEVLDGSLPQKKRRLVEAWAELHRGDCRRIGSGYNPGDSGTRWLRSDR